MKDHFISFDQARYATSVMAKYLYTTIVKKSTSYDIIFTKDDASASDEKVEKLSREFSIHYRAYIGSFIYFLSTIVDLSYVVHKLAKFSSNPCKVHFEGLVHLMRLIRDNKTSGLKYYADRNDAPLSDLLRQTSIKSDNQLMDFSDSIWKDCPYTGRSTGAYIISYQGWPIDHNKKFGCWKWFN